MTINCKNNRSDSFCSKKKQRYIDKQIVRHNKMIRLIHATKMMKLDIGSLSLLPIEILQLIFEMLPFHSIIQLSNSCTTLSKICYDSYTTRNHIFNFVIDHSYYKFSIDDSSIPVTHIMDFVFRWPMSRINLSNTKSKLSIDQIKEIIYFSPNLTEIDLSHILNIDDDMIHYILNNCQHIKSITVSCPLQDTTTSYTTKCIGNGFTNKYSSYDYAMLLYGNDTMYGNDMVYRNDMMYRIYDTAIRVHNIEFSNCHTFPWFVNQCSHDYEIEQFQEQPIKITYPERKPVNTKPFNVKSVCYKKHHIKNKPRGTTMSRFQH
jgi:hypothetical protein